MEHVFSVKYASHDIIKYPNHTIIMILNMRFNPLRFYGMLKNIRSNLPIDISDNDEWRLATTGGSAESRVSGSGATSSNGVYIAAVGYGTVIWVHIRARAVCI